MILTCGQEAVSRIYYIMRSRDLLQPHLPNHYNYPITLLSTAADTLHTGLKKLISLNASVALFVWHGGSNFGIDSGAYTTTTSYDYDAPMSEAGKKASFLNLKS